MDEADVVLQQQLAPALQQLQPTALQAIHHQPNHQAHALASHLPPGLQGLDSADHDAFQQRLHAELANPGDGQHLQSVDAFDQTNARPNAPPRTPQHQVGGQFGVLTPGAPLTNQTPSHHDAISRLQQEDDPFLTPGDLGKSEIHLDPSKIVPEPPNLQEWRQKLFDVNDTITLSEEEYQTYFPHVDNIYSHRSTQRYKRKPFISHYWDCRLKGRPPGTPKSDDPSKKKRKRTARERDLCDVKIKITEYFPGAMLSSSFSPAPSPQLDGSNNFFAPSQAEGSPLQQQQVPFGMLTPSGGYPLGHLSSNGGKYYTIQRVNGNGGNGKSDGVAGPHKHTLEDSDRVKKNSVQRYVMKAEKNKKKTQIKSLRRFRSVPNVASRMSDKGQSEQKTYHKKATGAALVTVKKHSKETDLKLFGSCFCPFVQRVWISLEVKGLSYQYIEVDPYKKPESLLEVNPRGLVPALRHGDWGCYESTVLMEYLEDLNAGTPLLPVGDPQLRAHSRLWSDHINRHIIPLFYRTLQSQDQASQISSAEELKTEISKLVDVADPSGPFFLGPTPSFVDVQFAPWMLRLSRVLKPYRGWPDPEGGSRWGLWLDAVEACEEIKATTSADELYKDSYERYAENRPDTSQLARAINAGHGLP
ncbi:MAG: hypothetical protein M1833_002890 [Piccolia ochrophora]|nr:MAG: hypothetical protein M1833_002890 [Piccolia ochrophora]